MTPPRVIGPDGQKGIHVPLVSTAKPVVGYEEFKAITDELSAIYKQIEALKTNYNQDKMQGTYLALRFNQCRTLVMQAYEALASEDYAKVKQLLAQIKLPDADELYTYFSLKKSTVDLFSKEDVPLQIFEQVLANDSLPDNSLYKQWAKLGKLYLALLDAERKNDIDEVEFIETSLGKILGKDPDFMKDSTIKYFVALMKARIYLAKGDYNSALAWAEKIIRAYGNIPKEFSANAKLMKINILDRTNKMSKEDALSWYEVYAQDKELGTVSYEASILLAKKQMELGMHPWAIVTLDRLVQTLATKGDGNSALYKYTLELLASYSMKYASILGFKDKDGNELISTSDENYDDEVNGTTIDINNDDHISKSEIVAYAYRAIKSLQKKPFYKEEMLTAVRQRKQHHITVAISLPQDQAPAPGGKDDTASAKGLYRDALRLASGKPVLLASAGPIILADVNLLSRPKEEVTAAQEKLEGAIKKDPLYVEAFIALGIICRSRGDLFKALEYFKLAKQTAKIHLQELGLPTTQERYEYYSTLYAQAASFAQYTSQGIQDNLAPDTLRYVSGNSAMQPIPFYSPYVDNGFYFRTGDTVSTEVRGYMGAGFYLDQAQKHQLQLNAVGGTDMYGSSLGYAWHITPHTNLSLGLGTFWEGYTNSNFFTRAELGLSHRIVSDNEFLNGITLHGSVGKEWAELQNPLLFTPGISFVYPTGVDNNFGGEDGTSGDHFFGGSLGLKTDFTAPADLTSFFTGELFMQGHFRLGSKANLRYDASTSFLRPYNLDLGVESSGNGFLIGGGLKFNPNTLALGAVTPWFAAASLPYLSLGYRAQDGDAYRVKLQLGTIGVEKSAFHFGTQLWQVDIVYFPIFFPYITTRRMPGERGVSDDWKAWSAYPHLKKPELTRATNELDERFTFRFVGEEGADTENYAHVYTIIKYDSEGNIIKGKRRIYVHNGNVVHQDYVMVGKREEKADFSKATSADLLTAQMLMYKEAARKYYKAKAVEHLKDGRYERAIACLATLSVINPDEKVLAFIKDVAIQMEKKLAIDPSLKLSQKAEKLAMLYETVHRELMKAGKGYTLLAIKSKQYSNQARLYQIKFLRQEGQLAQAGILERTTYASMSQDLEVGFDISQLLPDQPQQGIVFQGGGHSSPKGNPITPSTGRYATMTLALSSSEGQDSGNGQDNGGQSKPAQDRTETHGYDTALIQPGQDAYRTQGSFTYENGVLTKKHDQKTSKITARSERTTTYSETKQVTYSEKGKQMSFESSETLKRLDKLIEKIGYISVFDPDAITELREEAAKIIKEIRKYIPAYYLVKLRDHLFELEEGEVKEIAQDLYSNLIKYQDEKMVECLHNLYTAKPRTMTIKEIFEYLNSLPVPFHPDDRKFLHELILKTSETEIKEKLRALYDKHDTTVAPLKAGAKTIMPLTFSLDRTRRVTFYDHRYVPLQYRGLLDVKKLQLSLPLTSWLILRKQAEWGSIQDRLNLGLDLKFNLGRGFKLDLGGDVDLYHKTYLPPYLLSYGYIDVGDAIYGDIRDTSLGNGNEENLENHQYLRIGWGKTTEGGYSHRFTLLGEHDDEQFRRHLRTSFGYQFADKYGSGLSMGLNWHGYNPGESNSIYATNYYFKTTHALTRQLFLDSWFSQQYLSNLDTSLAGHYLIDQYGRKVMPGGISSQIGLGLAHRTPYAESKFDFAVQFAKEEDLPQPQIKGDYDVTFVLSINNRVKIGDSRVTFWDYIPLLGLLVRAFSEPAKSEYQEKTNIQLIAEAKSLIDNPNANGSKAKKAIEILETVLWRDNKNIVAYQLLQKAYKRLEIIYPGEYKMPSRLKKKFEELKYVLRILMDLKQANHAANLFQATRKLEEKSLAAKKQLEKAQLAEEKAAQAKATKDPNVEELALQAQAEKSLAESLLSEKARAADELKQISKDTKELAKEALEQKDPNAKDLLKLAEDTEQLAIKASTIINPAALKEIVDKASEIKGKIKKEEIRILKVDILGELGKKLASDKDNKLYNDLYLQLIDQSITMLEKLLEYPGTTWPQAMIDMADVIIKAYEAKDTDKKDISITGKSKPTEEIKQVIKFLKFKREEILAVKLGIDIKEFRQREEYKLLH